MTEAGYLAPAYRAALGVVRDATGLLEFLRDYQHPPSKWTRPADAHPQNAQLTSVAWLHQQDGRLLTVRTRGRDRVYLFGGKIEPGESLEQALRREVCEELNVQLREVRPTLVVTALAHGLTPATELTMHCYSAVPKGALRPGREVEEIVWLASLLDPRAAQPFKSSCATSAELPPSAPNT